MKFGSKLATFVGAVILASSAFASNNVCPSIEEIQSEGISMAEEIAPGLFIAYQISNYNTEDTWGFIVAPLDGEDQDVAISMANDIVSDMTAPGIPEEHRGMLICTYETGIPDVFAAAIKDSQTVTPMKLKQFFKTLH